MADNDFIRRSDARIAIFERIKQIGYENDPLVLSIRQAVTDIPAADVAPVAHGRWIDKNAGNATCSVCKRRHKDVYDDDNSDSFCRSCGAKMEVQGA